jgi:hypothetical protein
MQNKNITQAQIRVAKSLINDSMLIEIKMPSLSERASTLYSS